MANNIRGITVEIGGDTTSLIRALRNVNTEIRNTSTRLREVDGSLRLDPSNITLWEQRQRLLNTQLEATRERLNTLREAQASVDEQFRNGDMGQDQYDAFNRELINTENQLRNVEREASQCDPALRAMGAAAAEVGGKFQAAGKMIMPFSIAAGGALTAATKFGSDYTDAMAKVATIADTSAIGLEDLDKAILELSTDTGIAATDIAENVYNAISAGQDTADAVNFVANATSLARAGFADSAAATDLLTTALNAYGMEASEVTMVSDMLIQTQNLGRTTVAELASSMGKVIPTANAMGVGIDQLAAGYTIMTSKGIKTAETTTYMNSMLNELGKSSSSISKRLQGLTGKSFAELTKEGKSVGDILQMLQIDSAGLNSKLAELTEGGTMDLDEAMQHLIDTGDASMASFINLWGSAEAGKAGLTLLSEGAKGFNDRMAALNASTGATAEALEKLQTPSQKSKETINALKNILIELGQVILTTVAPFIQSLADKIKQLATRFSELSPVTQGVIVAILALVAAAGPVLTGIGSLLVSVNALMPALSMVKTAILALNAPIVAIVAVIATLTAAFVYLYTTNEEFRTNIQAIWGAIKTFLASTLDFIKNNFSFVWETIQTVISTALTLIQDIVRIFADMLRGDWGAVWEDVKALVSNAVNGVVGILETWYSGVIAIVGKLVSWILVEIRGIVTSIKGYASSFLSAGRSIFNSLWDGLRSVWDGIYSWVEDKVRWIADKLAFWRSSKAEMSDGGGADGSHRNGLAYVPFDGYKAILHEGERVLTKKENEGYTAGSYGGDVNIYQTITTTASTAREQQRAAKKELIALSKVVTV